MSLEIQKIRETLEQTKKKDFEAIEELKMENKNLYSLVTQMVHKNDDLALSKKKESSDISAFLKNNDDLSQFLKENETTDFDISQFLKQPLPVPDEEIEEDFSFD